MKLNIYKGKKVIKTYETSEYDLPFGIVEDVTSVVDIDGIQSMTDTEILKMVGKAAVKSMDSIKELLHDMFPEITDEEIRATTIPEIAGVIIDVVKYTITLLGRGLTEKK